MPIKNKTNNKKFLNGSKLKVAIVVARWNSEITNELLADALESLKKCKLGAKNIKIISDKEAEEKMVWDFLFPSMGPRSMTISSRGSPRACAATST